MGFKSYYIYPNFKIFYASSIIYVLKLSEFLLATDPTIN